jgi:hypothetical protein
MCRGIVAVFSREEVASQLFHESNLPPRWRLSKHPEYPAVMHSLGLVISSAPVQTNNTVNMPSAQSVIQGIELDVYHSLPVPKKTNQRYAKLYAMGCELATFGSSGDDHRYKVASLELTRLINKLKAPEAPLNAIPEAPGNIPVTVPVATFLPPVQRGGSRSRDALANKSNKSARRSKTSPRNCKECAKVGLPGIGHIASSSDCPAKRQRISSD